MAFDTFTFLWNGFGAEDIVRKSAERFPTRAHASKALPNTMLKMICWFLLDDSTENLIAA